MKRMLQLLDVLNTARLAQNKMKYTLLIMLLLVTNKLNATPAFYEDLLLNEVVLNFKSRISSPTQQGLSSANVKIVFGETKDGISIDIKGVKFIAINLSHADFPQFFNLDQLNVSSVKCKHNEFNSIISFQFKILQEGKVLDTVEATLYLNEKSYNKVLKSTKAGFFKTVRSNNISYWGNKKEEKTKGNPSVLWCEGVEFLCDE